MSIIAELRRRKVVQVAAVYAVVAWLLVQVVVSVEAPLKLPDWADTLVIVLLAVGFPVALILSWMFDLSGGHLVRDRGDEPEAAPAEHEKPPAESGRLANSIAVLPFENLSPNPDDAFFAAGMHEELLNELARIRGLSVIARTSVLRYGKDPQPIPQIAAALNVETVMEGSVRYAGNRVRVTAQLIDGVSGAHLWTEAYDGDISDVFKIQSDIATTIAEALKAELLPEARAQIEKPPTTSQAAYALYLQASANALGTRQKEAIGLLDRALAIDPDFALAYARRGQVRAFMLINGFVAAANDLETLRELERSVIADADRALVLDPTLGPAWTVRGTVNQLCWRWKSAREDYQRALELSPNDPGFMNAASMFFADSGDCKRAMSLARRMAELNPGAMNSYTTLYMVGEMCGCHDEADDAGRMVAQLAPEHPAAISFEGHMNVRTGNHEAAAAIYRRAEALITEDWGHFMPAIIYGYGRMGRRDDARRLFERYKDWATRHSAGTGGWQFAYLGIGETETAYEWLQRTVEVARRCEPDAGYMALLVLKHNLQSDPVLEEPRFRKLFDEIDAIANSH